MKAFGIVFFLILQSSLSWGRPPSELKANQDVFVCQDQVKTLPLEEYKLIAQKEIALGAEMTSLSKALDSIQQNLNHFTSSRARMLNLIQKDLHQNIVFQKGIVLQRVSPSSQLLVPDGCRVEPLLTLTVPRLNAVQSFSAIVNEDLFLQMSIESQAISLWVLALDIEQLFFGIERLNREFDFEFDFDQLRSRQFIQCWLDSDCKPQSLAKFHEFTKNLKLDYFEQDHILIPKNSPVWNSKGLIARSKKTVQVVSSDLQNVLQSFVQHGDKKYFIPGIGEGQPHDLVAFNSSGEARCANLKNVYQEGIFSGLWRSASGGDAFPFSFPLCWNDDFQMIQGYFPVSWEENFEFEINGSRLKFYKDKLAGSPDQGGMIIRRMNKKIKWLSSVKGLVRFGQNGELPVNGYIKYRDDDSAECAQIGKDLNIKSVSGRDFMFRLNNRETDFLICFTSSGLYEKSISRLEFNQFMVKELVPFGNE